MRLKISECQVIDLYKKGESLREIEKNYKISRKYIKKILLKNNIKLRTLSEANRIYSLNEDIFNVVDSHEKAYWLGFIAADGSIYNNEIKIGLAFKDIDHLIKFKKFLNSTHPIHLSTTEVNSKKYKTCTLSVRSDKLKGSLNALNIESNKSKTLKPSNIDDKYLSSYFCGIIDGDGCYHVDKKNQIKMNLISSIFICEFFMKKIVENCKVTATKILEEKRSSGMFYCYFGGNIKIKKIINFLYKDTPVWLDRKRNLVLNHFKEKNNEII